MTVYVLGAGASISAGYPLASKLLDALSAWLDRCDDSIHWVPSARNRIIQLRETFGSLDNFEAMLGRLDEHGQERIAPTGNTTYRQDSQDTIHEYMERLQGAVRGSAGVPTEGFNPEYLQDKLVSAFREFFYEIETKRSEPTGYDSFARQRAPSQASSRSITTLR